MNSTSKIHIYCQKLKLESPRMTVTKKGSEHMPSYLVECVFQNLFVVGEGSTIKSAKESAMIKLVDMLRIPDDFFKRETTYFIDYSTSMSDLFDSVERKEYVLTMRKKTGDDVSFKKFKAVICPID